MVRFRQALIDDRDAILAFHRALYESHRSAKMRPELEPLYAYRDFPTVLADDVDAMIRNPATAILLAESDDGPCGYITGYVENDARRQLDRKGVVGDWYVAEGHRGQGVGRGLLDRLLAIFAEAGCNITEIATWPFNDATRRHIEAAGYEEIQIVYRRKL